MKGKEENYLIFFCAGGRPTASFTIYFYRRCKIAERMLRKETFSNPQNEAFEEDSLQLLVSSLTGVLFGYVLLSHLLPRCPH